MLIQNIIDLVSSDIRIQKGQLFRGLQSTIDSVEEIKSVLGDLTNKDIPYQMDFTRIASYEVLKSPSFETETEIRRFEIGSSRGPTNSNYIIIGFIYRRTPSSYIDYYYKILDFNNVPCDTRSLFPIYMSTTSYNHKNNKVKEAIESGNWRNYFPYLLSTLQNKTRFVCYSTRGYMFLKDKPNSIRVIL